MTKHEGDITKQTIQSNYPKHPKTQQKFVAQWVGIHVVNTLQQNCVAELNAHPS
jgi:hypothetical protein